MLHKSAFADRELDGSSRLDCIPYLDFEGNVFTIYNFRIKMGSKLVFSLEIRWHNDGYCMGGAIIQ